MQVVHTRCAGLDVHKRTVVACVLLTQDDGTVVEAVRTVSTMTADLAALSAWLREQQVTCVALESSGVYWWPVFNLLEEEGHQVVLVNAQHMRAIPGRKTDIADSKWLADLLRHGLLRARFIPPAAIRAWRDVLRYRATLVRQRTQEINRLQKVLEGANIKLAAVASDILGASGRHMLAALAAGADDAEVLAEMAQQRLRAKSPALRQALEGRVQPHHRVLIRAILAHVEFLEREIAALDHEVQQSLAPFAREMALLQTLPGVHQTAAATIIAEIGVDMSRFASAQHLASWAGVCPGNRQSGGKRLSSQIRPGNGWLRGLLAQVAWAAVRTKGTAFGARFRRIARRQGRQKALVAVMHHLLVVIYAMLRDQLPYRELGPDYYQPTDPARQRQRLVQRLEQLGYAVTLTAAEVV
jgi:transposase